MNNKEVMQQALEALERAVPTGEITLADWMKAATDLRAALAEPEQHADPTDPGHDVDVLREHVRHLERRVRELAPPQRKPLTEMEVLDAYCNRPHANQFVSAFLDGVRFAEQAHGIALRAALAEPEQEPVASLMTHVQSGDMEVAWNDDGFAREMWHETPLYAAPPQRDEIERLRAALQALVNALDSGHSLTIFDAWTGAEEALGPNVF